MLKDPRFKDFDWPVKIFVKGLDKFIKKIHVWMLQKILKLNFEDLKNCNKFQKKISILKQSRGPENSLKNYDLGHGEDQKIK